jgi:type IV pilus assembly protein PilC
MAVFTCKIGSTDGRIQEKDFEAANADLLKRNLEEQGLFVFGIRKKPLQFLRESGGKRRVGSRDLLAFNQELLVLLKAGLPMIQALDTILEKVEKGTLAEVLREVREEIKGGQSLSEALAKFPRVFPHLYVASIRAGERTGDLPLTIRRFNDYLKKAQVLKKKLVGALVYPAILVTFAMTAVAILLIYVVPTFSQVYADSGSQLPVPTQMLITFTGILKKYILVVVALMVAGVFAFRKWAATPEGRFRVDSLKLRLPVFGDVMLKYSLSSFIRTFGTVIGSGIPIVESLKMSLGTLNNVVLERKLLEAVVRVEEGTRLSAALEHAGLMPPLALRMIGVGETIGSLEEMLADLSEYFEEEIEGRLHVLTTAIEPAIMLVMGVLIGAIIITMYLPVFKMGSTIG